MTPWGRFHAGDGLAVIARYQPVAEAPTAGTTARNRTYLALLFACHIGFLVLNVLADSAVTKGALPVALEPSLKYEVTVSRCAVPGASGAAGYAMPSLRFDWTGASFRAMPPTVLTCKA